MHKTAVIAIVVVIGFAAIAAPIAFSVYAARGLALDTETANALAYAQDVIHRSDRATDQIGSGIKRLTGAAHEPCSDQEIALMREIALASSYLQAIGRVRNDRLICSSLGRHVEGFPLGPVDGRSPGGTLVRANVVLPPVPDTTFIVVERDNFAAIIHKALPIDATTGRPDTSLALFSRLTGQMLTSRGTVRPEWLSATGDRNEAAFSDSGYIVAVVHSQRYHLAALSAIPMTSMTHEMRTFSERLVPIGLVGGLILALAVGFLARQQLALPSVIRSALKRNEFFLVYQPVVDLRTGRWVGAEALIRWKRTNGEMIRPDLFIAVAEEAGLIQRITRRVLELVEGDARDLFRRFPGFHLGINLAAADLQSRDSVELVRSLGQRLKAGPGNLIVEATERGFIKPDVAREVVKQMRACGVSIAIDDFGTGYSSLSYLQTLEVDYLKIDRSFVDTIGGGAATSQVVLHIIEMAKALKLQIIAEGVETVAQAQYLQEHGVQFAQGWLYARPMSMNELTAHLVAREVQSPSNSVQSSI
ncbi:EAL domain-containing protein [Paraburkholderia sp. BL17N1]|uniref:EAL domain-containing protein n=1 Tax=Paraburkholderia sp. BL17N1 TaxID=1938798 RepID=UPI000EAB523F|nr:EAL domain-containing protein [Paraburkholderia sp. BL17N1]RKR37640.1 sensor c-di-GMP phosphodiesterase-like protein [Paraburkholderia sp. BL17N1]